VRTTVFLGVKGLWGTLVKKVVPGDKWGGSTKKRSQCSWGGGKKKNFARGNLTRGVGKRSKGGDQASKGFPPKTPFCAKPLPPAGVISKQGVDKEVGFEKRRNLPLGVKSSGKLWQRTRKRKLARENVGDGSATGLANKGPFVGESQL